MADLEARLNQIERNTDCRFRIEKHSFCQTPQTTDGRLIRQMKEAISRFKEIELGYLFGSFVKKETFGDIDIAVLLSESKSPYKNFKFAMKVGRLIEENTGFQHEIDVKILNASPLPFQYQVIREGKPVFIRDKSAYIQYETRLLSQYLDYQETLNWFNKRFLERIS